MRFGAEVSLDRPRSSISAEGHCTSPRPLPLGSARGTQKRGGKGLFEPSYLRARCDPKTPRLRTTTQQNTRAKRLVEPNSICLAGRPIPVDPDDADVVRIDADDDRPVMPLPLDTVAAIEGSVQAGRSVGDGRWDGWRSSPRNMCGTTLQRSEEQRSGTEANCCLSRSWGYAPHRIALARPARLPPRSPSPILDAAPRALNTERR